jgi:hypothetical protein
MKSTRGNLSLVGWVTTLTLIAGAVAQTQPAMLEQPPVVNDEPHWRFEIAPYIWAVSLDGHAAAAGNRFEVDAPFTDTLENSDTLIGLMGHFEAGRGRWSAFFSPAYSVTGYDDVATGLGDLDVEITLAWYELGGAYRICEKPLDGAQRWSIDAIAGVRITDIKLDLDLDAGGSRDDSETWVEPFIGARTSIDFARHFSLRLRGDIGGFGAGSDFAWQTAALVGWSFDLFGADGTLFLGYRALGQDYDHGSFEWDVIAHGPMFGLAIQW